MTSHDSKHDRRLLRVLNALPHRVRRAYLSLIRPDTKWVRRPLSMALIAGGTLGFLPVLGFRMLPLGALLLGEDIPPVRRATLRALDQTQYWWSHWRQRGRRRAGRCKST